MLGSAFVVESVWGLALVVQLLVVLAYLQRFVGRLASLVVGLAGHVGAGLVVAAGLATGIFHGFVDESVAAATDVGVSYVMAAAMGFLVLAVPPRWRWWYLGATAVYWLLPGAINRTFTDAGHASALTIGLLLALVAARAVAADHRARRTARTASTRGATGSDLAGQRRPDHDAGPRPEVQPVAVLELATLAGGDRGGRQRVARAADVGAVGGLQVLDPPALTVGVELAVPARDPGVRAAVDRGVDVARHRRAADEHAALPQRHQPGQARPTASGPRASAPRTSRGPPRSRRPRSPGRRARGRAGAGRPEPSGAGAGGPTGAAAVATAGGGVGAAAGEATPVVKS